MKNGLPWETFEMASMGLARPARLELTTFRSAT